MRRKFNPQLNLFTTMATVHVGEYSRGRQSRRKLVPGGILEPVSGKSFLFFGVSNKTSDFLVDDILLRTVKIVY